MALTLEQSRKIRYTGQILVVGIIAGLVYPIFSDGFTSIYPYINGLIGGTMVALCVAFFELIIFTGSVKRRPFYQLLVLRVVVYSICIIGFLLLIFISYRMLRFDLSFNGVLQSEEFNDYIWNKDFVVVIGYTFSLVFLTGFTWQMSRKMGQGILWEFITGAYYQPKEEERIIMFLSILKPQKTIRKIGRLNYHRFLNDIIFDITNTILSRKGEIYEYVDHELVLVWKKERGIINANCIRVFFDIKNTLEANHISYYEKYGVIPQIKASLHIGKVIKGEIGTVKSEMSYYGDPMNTGSRILGKCDKKNDFLVSASILELLQLPKFYKTHFVGNVLLKGKQSEVELFAIHEKTTQPVYS